MRHMNNDFWDSLTNAELKICPYLAMGWSHKEITSRLNISRGEFSKLVCHLYKKANIPDYADTHVWLVLLLRGLIPHDSNGVHTVHEKGSNVWNE